MPQEIISKKTKDNLEILTSEGMLKTFYLAGGTGVALQLKHRVSLDLDFFTEKDIGTKILIQILKSLAYFEDAENNPMPKMIVSASWQEIKNFFQQEIRKINNK